MFSEQVGDQTLGLHVELFQTATWCAFPFPEERAQLGQLFPHAVDAAIDGNPRLLVERSASNHGISSVVKVGSERHVTPALGCEAIGHSIRITVLFLRRSCGRSPTNHSLPHESMGQF